MLKPLLAILFAMATTTGLLSNIMLTSINNVYGQNGPVNTMPQANNQIGNTNAKNTLSSSSNGVPIISTYIPLSGQLAKGYYIHLADFSGFNIGKTEISMQVPCDYYGKSMVGVIAGVASNFQTIDIGNPVGTATLDGKPILNLSYKGISCLYKAAIPLGVTEIELINTSGQLISFGQGMSQYGVTITTQIS